MRAYWPAIIAPILAAVRPRSVVEVGAGDGINTLHLLELAAGWNGIVHAVDPLPRFAVEELESRYAGRFRFHRMLGRDALAQIGCADAYLLNGDLNWYSVVQELQAVEHCAREAAAPAFPLVFLHGTGWPYARRDRYCDPLVIPEAHRQRFRRAGVALGQAGLAGSGDGLHPDDNHAIAEGGAHNGVRTGLEDFARESGFNLAVLHAAAFHGMSVIADAAMLDPSSALAGVLGELRWPPAAERLLEGLERDRVEAVLAIERESRLRTRGAIAYEAQLRKLKSRHARVVGQLKQSRTDAARGRRENAALAKARDRALERARELDGKLARLRVLSEFRTRVDARVAGHVLGRLLPRLVRAFQNARDRRGVSHAFDPAWYREQYPDIDSAGLDPLDHYLQRGVFEGRDPRSDFHTVDYLLSHPEVVAAGVNPLLHFASAGSVAMAGAAPGNGSMPRPGEPR